MLRVYILFLVILSCFVLTACLFSAKPIYHEDDKRVALEHIGKFHRYLSSGDYDRIYDLFNDQVRSKQSREQFIQALRNLHDSAGAFKSHSILKIEIKPQAKFRVVHIILESEFERKRVLEEFDCLVEGKEAVFGFYGQPEKPD